MSGNISGVTKPGPTQAGTGDSIAYSPVQRKPRLDLCISGKSGAAAVCVGPEVWGK